MEIRKIEAAEYLLVRELRLLALSDAVDSFNDSKAKTLKKPESYWIELTNSLTQVNIMFVVEADGDLDQFMVFKIKIILTLGE